MGLTVHGKAKQWKLVFVGGQNRVLKGGVRVVLLAIRDSRARPWSICWEILRGRLRGLLGFGCTVHIRICSSFNIQDYKINDIISTYDSICVIPLP